MKGFEKRKKKQGPNLFKKRLSLGSRADSIRPLLQRYYDSHSSDEIDISVLLKELEEELEDYRFNINDTPKNPPRISNYEPEYGKKGPKELINIEFIRGRLVGGSFDKKKVLNDETGKTPNFMLMPYFGNAKGQIVNKNDKRRFIESGAKFREDTDQRFMYPNNTEEGAAAFISKVSERGESYLSDQVTKHLSHKSPSRTSFDVLMSFLSIEKPKKALTMLIAKLTDIKQKLYECSGNSVEADNGTPKSLLKDEEAKALKNIRLCETVIEKREQKRRKLRQVLLLALARSKNINEVDEVNRLGLVSGLVSDTVDESQNDNNNNSEDQEGYSGTNVYDQYNEEGDDENDG